MIDDQRAGQSSWRTRVANLAVSLFMTKRPEATAGGFGGCCHENEQPSIESAFENQAKVYCCLVCCVACARRIAFAGSVSAAGSVTAGSSVTTKRGLSRETSGENTSGSARFSGRAYRPLSGPFAGPDLGGIHLSSRNHPAAAVAYEKP